MDVETGYYYLQSRYYDPGLRRFISSDNYDLISTLAEAGDINLFVYCGNNPVMYTDSTGCAPVWWNPFSWFDNVSDVGKLIIGGLSFLGAVGLTIMTGGALTGLLIGMTMGVASSTLIGGFGAVISSGGDWSQFGVGAWSGFVDGVLWGGIFSLAGATVGAVKYTIKSKGAVPGTKHLTTIKKGQQFYRYGKLTGRYITDVGVPAEMLALPASNPGVKTTLQATRKFRVYTGIVADAFGGTGGGIQYVMRYSIDDLIRKGWLIVL